MSSVTPPQHRRYVELTPDKEQKISQLVQRMQQTYSPLPEQLQVLLRYAPRPADAPTPHNTIRHYCYCALISRNWDLQRAFAMLEENVAYRRQWRLDERSEMPTSISLRGWEQMEVVRALGKEPRLANQRADKIVALLGRHFPCGLHRWDKHGQPVFYVLFGRIEEEAIVRKLKQVANVGQAPEDVVWEMLQHLIGVGEWLAYYQQMQYDAGRLDVDATEGLIRATTIVVDMKGFGYSMIWKPAIDLAVSCLKKLFRYYAECVHQVLVVNAPSMVSFGYRIVRPAVPATVQAKVRIAGPDASLALLKEYIDEAFIPAHLGGQCSCEGGCCTDYNPNPQDVLTATEEHQYGGVSTDDITLRAGAAHRIVFALRQKETVVWDFISASGHDIAFATFFVPSSQCAGVDMEKADVRSLEAYVVSKTNPSEGSDEYKATEDGVLVLVWDNKQSWVTTKHLQMKVFKQQDLGKVF
ncbi:hypothetical protein ABB37_05866 [Leptomonas pyrrhocoris]|uniref:CRAL-TRIO domain-containing protein n=1 Tax=Leptomonas pyrrhocoris TaxID=157538 RepID=A0A0N0DUE2_LEPPY|nr:hypothetical protein ABB37_05866 [Leptomonas pyrrhocoris]KPA78748.1 hypothetical protein ABB37_05866 [Leptomonas pyrrhocoris]|eukprot:XP_015657187.1 hypothetical protein ABB37_05866 [Leptomonas pyrrhocoris]